MNVLQVVLGHLIEVLEGCLSEAEGQLRACTSAHDVSAVGLRVLGVTRDSAYQAMPEMHPRTVRRLACELPSHAAVLMYMNSKQEEPSLHVHVDSTDQVQQGIAESLRLADIAGVKHQQVLQALLRYGNPPEVVQRRLGLITTIARMGGRVHNPTGLFVRCMRRGEDPILPARAEQAQSALADRPAPLAVGDVVYVNLELQRVVEVGANRCVLEGKDGLINYQTDLALLYRRTRSES